MNFKEIIRCKECGEEIHEYDIDVRDSTGRHWCWECWNKHCKEIDELSKQTEYRKGKK